MTTPGTPGAATARQERAMPHTPGTEPDHIRIYHIRVKGHLGPRWRRWFDGMTIILQANGETLLTGPIADQAALHGILTRIRDLGLILVSVIEVDPEQANMPGVSEA